MTPPAWVVVTDLDGTLLDAESYAWAPARATLARLSARSIPVIFCTSKTRAETEVLQRRIDVHDPFIVENGAAICTPEETVVLGTPYAEILTRFQSLKELTGGALRGFSDLTTAELARQSGLTIAQAAAARQREYEEPFSFLRDEAVWLPVVIGQAARWGLRVSRGGRYWHLHGDNDKGRAVRRLLLRYPNAKAVGLGDSALDLPMLEAVSLPVAVARPDGSHDPVLESRLPGLVKTVESGPTGWARAVDQLILWHGSK